MATLETKSGIEVEDFRKDDLFGLPSTLRKNADWSSTFLYNKIRAAEDELERTLGIYYKPQRIVCEPENRSVNPPLIKGTDYDVAEPAYDYSSDFYVGENWGGIRLRHYPIHTTPKPTVTFAYPNIDHKIFTVPPEWIRLKGAYGQIRLVPASVTVYASFTAYILSVFSGGRGIPQSVFVDYTAGFDGVNEKGDLAGDFMDLLELTKQLAVLNILDAAFLPSSTSNSADGLSQSNSYAVKDFRTSYDKKLRQLRDRIKGVRLAVV